ncbi:type IV pili twitching motility protein PilT, partial [Acinetobacter nosocomialis]
ILINTPLLADYIRKGEIHEIKDLMKRSRELGMQTFDQALFDLYNQEIISYDEALRNADSSNEMRLQIKLKSSRINPALQEEGSKMRILEQSKETTLSRI